MQIQMLEARWTSPEAKEMAEHYQREIAKVFTIPAHRTHVHPDEAFVRRAMAAAEPLRRELARLTEVCSLPPQMVVSASNLMPGILPDR